MANDPVLASLLKTDLKPFAVQDVTLRRPDYKDPMWSFPWSFVKLVEEKHKEREDMK